MKCNVMFCAASTFIVCLVVAAATLAVNAEETSISEKSFGCIRDSAVKVEGTYIRHADPAKLKEAVQIFEGDVADKEYPVGTTIQLIPGEAMVKESKKEFPNTNGWEFFALTVSANGTKIASRGDSASNTTGSCLGCHEPAAKFDYICKRNHGCASIPFTDEQIATLQDHDARCTK